MASNPTAEIRQCLLTLLLPEGDGLLLYFCRGWLGMGVGLEGMGLENCEMTSTSPERQCVF